MSDQTTETEPQKALLRYSNFNVAIHWTTAALVLLQIWLGFSFADMERGAERTTLFTWHRTVGALILLITLARLTYRLFNPPPPYPPELPRWERIAGTWNHRIFYLLLIGLPIGGLIAVSGHTSGPTIALIGGVFIPKLPGISEQLGEVAGEFHSTLAWLLIVLIALHAGAALKHQFFDRNRAAGRMPPFKDLHAESVMVGQGKQAGSS